MSTGIDPPGSGLKHLYYGWWIVLGAVIGQFVAIGVGGQVSGVFLRPVVTDLGWTAAQFTAGTSAAFVMGGLAGFFVGPFIDRRGPRPLMLVGGFTCGLSLILISRVNHVWQFIALQMLAGGLGFALIGPLVVNVTLSKWFVLRRGWAIAIGSMGVSLAGLVMPVTMTQVVDAFGWRAGYATMGLLVWALVIPVALIMRRSPEDYGLVPDGRREEQDPSPAQRRQLEAIRRDLANSYTRSEAARTPALWLLVVGFGLNQAAMGAMLVHAIPFVTDAHFTRAEASIGLMLTGAANLCSKFVWGWTLQRVSVRRLAACAFGASAVGVSLIITATRIDALPLLLAAFFVWGFGFGGTIPIGEFIWAQYFGRRNLGSVRGLGVPFTILFGSLGPISVAVAFDRTGAYGGAFTVLVGAYVVAGLLVLASRQPPPKEPAVQPEAPPATAPMAVADAPVAASVPSTP
ncbi:MAG: MFS transporter [Dehalococcoidia bacterium]|nr:MFS transporter [Dehalococcoidia bacterium]